MEKSVKFSDLKRICAENKNLTKTKIHELKSYCHIAKSVFLSTLNNHDSAVEAVTSALSEYVQSIKNSNSSKQLEKFKNTYNRMLSCNSSEDIEEKVANLSLELASLYKQEHTEWYSDILNYLGYIFITQLESQRSYLALMPAFFFRIATDINEQNYVAHNNVGYVCGLLGNLDGAKNWIEKSIEINRLFPLSCYNLANILVLQGKISEAAKCLTYAAKHIDPSFEHASESNKDASGQATHANCELLKKIGILLQHKDSKHSIFYRLDSHNVDSFSEVIDRTSTTLEVHGETFLELTRKRKAIQLCDCINRGFWQRNPNDFERIEQCLNNCVSSFKL